MTIFWSQEMEVPFFEKSKVAKEALIKSKLNHSMYNVSDFIEIEPTETTQKSLSEYKLIYKKTSLGFVIGVQVREELKLGATLYKPRFTLPETLSLTFSINTVASHFLSMTNIGMRPTLPTIYYFTNKGKQEFTETGPGPNYKSLPIAEVAEKHKDGMNHEMGTLLKFGTNLREKP